MLILTRKIGETITIGDRIKIVVVDIKGKQVRLGIEAPEETAIFREEIYQRIQEENRLAAQLDFSQLDQLTDVFYTLGAVLNALCYLTRKGRLVFAD